MDQILQTAASVEVIDVLGHDQHPAGPELFQRAKRLMGRIGVQVGIVHLRPAHIVEAEYGFGVPRKGLRGRHILNLVPGPDSVRVPEGRQTGFLGNQLFSLLVSGGFSLNFKNRSGEDVQVTQGEVTGTIDKRGIGAEDGRLLDAVVQTHGNDLGADFINKMTKMTIAICTSMGFTTGIDDEDLPPEAHDEIARINTQASSDVDAELEKFGKDGRKYEARPGRTPHETLEENILTILDAAKAETGNVAKKELGDDNSAVLMATSGARGSMDNLAMMAGSIGQPKVRGKRLERGYQDRVLSHFPRKVKGSKEKGFVSSSFKRGLEPTEFFMLSVSGRESLVDTAVRTSKSGYMQRRLINAMDDLKVANDVKASVRNTANRIIQFEYGEDGTDPARSRKGSPFDVDQVLNDALGGAN